MDMTAPSLGLADTISPEKRRKKNIILGISFGLLALVIIGAISVTMWRMKVKEEKEKQEALDQARREHQAVLTNGNLIYTNFAAVLSNVLIRIEADHRTVQAAGAQIADLQIKAKSANSEGATAAAGSAADLLKQIVARVDKLTNAVSGLVQLGQIGASNQLIMTQTRSAAEAQVVVQQLTAAAEKADEVWKLVQQVDGQTAALTNQLVLAQEKLKMDKSTADQDAARRAAEKAEQDRKAAEAKAVQLKAEEQRKLAAKEKDAVSEAVKKNLELIRKNEFIDAAAALESSLNEIGTEEGKAARQAALDRCAQLEKLKAFFVESIPKECKANPKGCYPYGWLGNLDILGASAAAVEVRGSKVAWNKVPIQQMITFIRHYIKDAQELSRKERSLMSLAAAVYFYESSGGDKRALAQAARYAGDAIALDADLKREVERLMPDLALP
jgi:preprotein translocase subunit YajC